MLSVILALCAIAAVIWWLTGSARSHSPVADSDLQSEAAVSAIDRLAKFDALAASTPHGSHVGSVLYETLVGVGMDSDEALAAVRGFGYSASPTTQEDSGPKLTVFSMKEENARASLERAILVGIQLARMDDDYAGVSDDSVAFASLRERADEVETRLFDDQRRGLLDFYSRAVLVLQDRIQSEPDEEKRRAIGGVLGRFDEELTGLQDEMARAMADLPDDPARLAWGDSEDRRTYYFKMGVTNSLRRSGHLSSLSSLYRFRGVNYDVEEAFQLSAEDEPLLLQTVNLDFSTLVSLGPPDVRRMTSERVSRRSIT